MKTVFADTSYYLALVNPRDQYHSAACRWTADFAGTSLTTSWVIVELANAMSSTDNRPFFLSLLRDLQTDDRVKIVPPNNELFQRGLELYSRRSDKSWSLTDCISFLVMEERGVKEAATSDHHFTQAGFKALISRTNG
ncbi:MAG: type II toxin-antitoxin system VapC family toxin [Pirellulaceae bacterium]|nr:type II toxin-antitoxin system VapC family toxin [Pirellulaceae bacterium]